MSVGRGFPWSEEDAARIVGLYRAGVATKEIARRFNTTPSAIRALVSRKHAYRTLTRKTGASAYARIKRTLDECDNLTAMFGNVEQPAGEE